MFARISTLFMFMFMFLALPFLAAASAVPHGNLSVCNTGALLCCNSVVEAGSSEGTKALGLLGIPINNINIQIGLNCSPLSVIGIGGSSCATQPVCCTNNNFNDLVATGCSLVNVKL